MARDRNSTCVLRIATSPHRTDVRLFVQLGGAQKVPALFTRQSIFSDRRLARRKEGGNLSSSCCRVSENESIDLEAARAGLHFLGDRYV